MEIDLPVKVHIVLIGENLKSICQYIFLLLIINLIYDNVKKRLAENIVCAN